MCLLQDQDSLHLSSILWGCMVFQLSRWQFSWTIIVKSIVLGTNKTISFTLYNECIEIYVETTYWKNEHFQLPLMKVNKSQIKHVLDIW